MRGRKKRTTRRRDPYATPAADLVKRNFAAAAPDRIWTADITYVHTQEGFVYLAFILDVYSRRVVGWSMANHLRAELVVDALEMALWRRKPGVGLIHHSLIAGCSTRRRCRLASVCRKLWDSSFHGSGRISSG